MASNPPGGSGGTPPPPVPGGPKPPPGPIEGGKVPRKTNRRNGFTRPPEMPA